MAKLSFKNSLFVLMILFFLPKEMSASSRVRYISNADGLTNNSVNCIIEDADHTLWIGTWDGLNAYNGREIKTFRYSQRNIFSLSNNVIRQIIELDNDLWIATDNGVNRLDKRTKQIKRFYIQNDNKIPNQEKSFILAKKTDNTLFCLLKDKGLFVFDPQIDRFKLLAIDFVKQIKEFCIDKNNTMFFLMKDGAVKYVKNYSSFTGLNKLQINDLLGLNKFTKIVISNGRVILAKSKELFLLNPNLSIYKSINLSDNKTIYQILFLNESLYISYTEGGCIRYDLSRKKTSYLNEISSQMPITALLNSSQGVFWLGSDGKGLLQYYDYNPSFKTIKTTHPVRSFCQDKSNQILVGTKGDGIKRFNKYTGELTDYLNEDNGLISNSVYVIRKNSTNDIFIGTEGVGINIINAITGKLTKLKIPQKFPLFKAVYSLCFTNEDSILWVGTSGYGLIKITLGKDGNGYVAKQVTQFMSSDKRYSLNNDVVYSLFADDRNNCIWLGTRGGGISQLMKKNNRIVSLEKSNNRLSLTSNDVLCLNGNQDELWIGTSYGINKLDIGSSMKNLNQYAENVQLSNYTIHGILKDSRNQIWVSSNKGLSCINLSNHKIHNYTINDGLQNNEFSDGAYYKDNQNILYFGGVSGFNFFDPQKITQRDYNAPLALSDLKIFSTSQNLSDRIKDGVLNIGYNERFVTFTFIAKDFINNQNCEYAYRLKNHSDEWIYMGNNPNLVFTQIPPGKYQLEVKSTNGDKVWGNNIYRLNIDVAYPWWLSIPAFIVYILICILGVYVTRSIIKNKMKLSRQILIEQLDKQNEQKAYESKLNFFTNVAHEFFTPLTLIYGPAQYLLERADIDSTTHKYLVIIKNNAERMQKLISELMEFRKAKSGHTPLSAEQIDIKLFTEEITQNFVEVLKENKIDFRLKMSEVSTFFSDRNSLEKIFFNLISNAFKYTPANGYIYIEVGQDVNRNNELCLSIRNSGKGFTESQINEVFDKFKIFDVPKVGNTMSTGVGLNLTKNLVELLGGQIKAASEVGKYVEFVVSIPPLAAEVLHVIKDDNGFIREAKNVDFDNNRSKSKKETLVLIVEDETSIRDMLKDILVDYNVKEARDGKEAILEIEKNHPDIIISDILMPNMDGISLIDHLKQNPKTGYIPIISISAKTSVEDQINAFNHGADAYLMKPFHPRQLISTLENLISRQTLLKDYFNSSFSAVKLKNGIELLPEDEELISSVITFIEKNIEDETLSPNSIADFIGVSKATLYRKFKEITDKTPSEFIRTIRLEHAAKLLKTTKLTALEIMYKCGFSNKSYFYREFLKQYGFPPKDYRNQIKQSSQDFD